MPLLLLLGAGFVAWEVFKKPAAATAAPVVNPVAVAALGAHNVSVKKGVAPSDVAAVTNASITRLPSASNNQTPNP